MYKTRTSIVREKRLCVCTKSVRGKRAVCVYVRDTIQNQGFQSEYEGVCVCHRNQTTYTKKVLVGVFERHCRGRGVCVCHNNHTI